MIVRVGAREQRAGAGVLAVAERLVVLVERPGDVELVGTVPDVLVAVRARVRHHHVVAFADELARRSRCPAWRCGSPDQLSG